MALVELDASGLRCAAGGFHVDPWEPCPVAVITHAHSDHARGGCGRYVCTPETAALLRLRLGDVEVVALDYESVARFGDVELSFHPAGHVLGSAQVALSHDGERWVVTGDYKRQSDPTSRPFESLRCDVLVTEATFGLPVFRWPSAADVVADILATWDEARESKRPFLLFCYALGKAQRILAELAKHTDRHALVHGALTTINELHRARGIDMLETRSATEAAKSDVRGALILAPISARGTNWIRRFPNAISGFASGWMRVRGNRRRRAIDRGFVLSDHADWNDLLRTIDESGAIRVIATHGYSEPLARYLRETRGLDASAFSTRYVGEDESPEGPSEARSVEARSVEAQPDGLESIEVGDEGV